MPAITHQRRDNIRKIVEMAMQFYDAKTKDEKRFMLQSYALSLAETITVKQQREWLDALTAEKERWEKRYGPMTPEQADPPPPGRG